MVLKNFSLQIPVGETVALVGSSGSGKSTVVSLIERFYDPVAGKVLLDGHDLKILHIKWLRDQIGLVSQEPILFATTILDNILYGNNLATLEQVIEAAKAANAHNFISELPDGYHTQTGERGVQLSGGQKQRVAIARAMLKNPKILLLDEATSALDSSSEHIVQEALDFLMMGRSTIVIAHRLSTIRNVNTIAVVQEGRIVEMGNHQELISKGEVGNYASLVRLQELAMVKDGMIVSPKEDKLRISTPDSVNGSERLSNVASKEIVTRDLTPDEMDYQSPGSNFYRLWKISLSEWKYAIPGFIGSVLSGFLVPVFSMMVSQIVRLYYYSDNDLMGRKIAMYALIFAGVGIASFGIHIMQHYFLGVTGENLTKWVRIQMFQVILRNEIGWFDQEENNSSQVVSHLALDSVTIRSAIVDRVSILIQNTTTLFTVFTLCFIMQWRIAFVVLATFPLLILAAFAENVAMKGFVGDIDKAHSSATMVAGEAVSNIRTVAAFNAEHKVLNSFHDKLRSVENQTLAHAQIAGFIYGLSQMCMYSSYALALWYGSQLIKDNITDFGNVIRMFVVVIFGAVTVAETLSLAPDIIKGGQALNSVFQTLDRKSHIDPDHPEYSLMHIKGNINFRSVEFHYPTRPQATIFKDLNLSIPAGQSLALVGHSGSGKSSIIALIMRFYDPVLGKIMIDETDIRELNLRAFRQHVGLVQQEPALFATTIRENILYGQGMGEASEEDMIQAAIAANADEFIRSLPNGYETLVGERGTQLSGGQKQRVAIARAVLKNPRILLLDEATSALDMDSEKVVQHALDKLMVGRTTVMIAHRLSTIRNASIIVVVEEGKIVEEGPHSQLVSKPNGSYSRLLCSQNPNVENNQAN